MDFGFSLEITTTTAPAPYLVSKHLMYICHVAKTPETQSLRGNNDLLELTFILSCTFYRYSAKIAENPISV